MKQFNLSSFKLALFSVCLLIFAVLTASLMPAMAANSTAEESGPYQSSFDDYKPLADESPTDWKTLNTQSSGSGHSMQGMQHQMSPEQMAAKPMDKESPAMEGMNHSDMQAMDHSQMKHDQTMAPMKGMDRTKMPDMDHDQMQAMPSNEASPVQHMDHAQMQGINHDQKVQAHDHAMPAMKGMHDSKSVDMQHSHDESMPDKLMSDETTQHEHSEMVMASAKPAEATAQSQYFQIIPNLHPMIVHFPIALTIVAFLFSLAAYVLRKHAFSAQVAAAGHFTLWLAAIGAATAVLFGWLAYNSVNHDDAGHAAMLLHRAWAIPTAIGLVLLASWDVWKHRVNELMSVPVLILLFVLAETVAVTGWLGGEVVYRHGIGVLSLPASEGSGHSHHHEHGADEHPAMSDTTIDTHADEETEHHHDDEKGESHEH